MSETDDFERLLAYLRDSRGFDFTGYKPKSLERRLHKRMEAIGVAEYGDYLDYLEVHPDEFPQLFNTLLINVTSFFRDPPAWEALAPLVADLVRARGDGTPLRIWSAGCATGEEAYTLAMMLAELIGQHEVCWRAKIYATDLDEDALQIARHATYSGKAAQSVPPPLLERYFTPVAGSFAFNKELRRCVIFGRHNLVHDAPISNIDLLVCRNTLMYFNAETQSAILRRLNFALADDGILFLGKAETLLTHGSLFSPLDVKHRIFRRVERRAEHPVRSGVRMNPDPPPMRSAKDSQLRLYQVAFDSVPFAQILVDGSGRLAMTNRRASALFGLNQRDIGRPFHDLELSYRPADLRSCIDRARAERETISLRGVERVAPNGTKSYLDIDVTAIDGENSHGNVQIVFIDVTQRQLLEGEVHKANAELERAHQELQSTSEELETTNEELQSTVEELETTNEELQSTVEELETTNEELQSTNEELETMNEELQSSNEELHTSNQELQRRSGELNQINGFFGSILSSLRAGVVVLDGELLVRAWNPQMEELWGLRADEVHGKHFLGLDVGLPVKQLSGPIRAALNAEESPKERTLECTNRRGRAILCRVTVSPLRGEQRGVILMFEEASS